MRGLPKGVGIGFKQNFLFIGLAHQGKTARPATRRGERLAVQLGTWGAVKGQHLTIGKRARERHHLFQAVDRERGWEGKRGCRRVTLGGGSNDKKKKKTR